MEHRTESDNVQKLSIEVNPGLRAVDEAYNVFLQTLDEYSKKNNLPQTQIDELKMLLKAAFIERKFGVMIEKNMSFFNQRLTRLLDASMRQQTSENNNQMNFIYYNEKNTFVNTL